MTANEMERARMRPRHERRDFATAMRDAGLSRCDECGVWGSDVVPILHRSLCGDCISPLVLKHPDPALFVTGTLEHLMASNLKEKTT